MNFKVVIGALLLSPLLANAQPPETAPGSTLTIYSDNHERFILLLDDKPQNTVAKDDIRLGGLQKQVYNGKIVFEDKSLPVLLADIRVSTPKGNRADAYYNIRRTLDGTIELHFLSVVPINDKYLTNDVKYFTHKGGYGGEFIDYTAPIAVQRNSKTKMVNGQSVTVTSSNTGFDLSGAPIKDKDVRFVDYTASSGTEAASTTTRTNANGETITTSTHRVNPNDVYGDASLRRTNKLYVPSEDPMLATEEHRSKPQPIDLNKLGDRQVVRTDVHGNYINIQNGSVTTEKLDRITRLRDDGYGQYGNKMTEINGGTDRVLSNQEQSVTTTTIQAPPKEIRNGNDIAFEAPPVKTTTITRQETRTIATPPAPVVVNVPTPPAASVSVTANPAPVNETVTRSSYSRRGRVVTTTTVTDVKPADPAPLPSPTVAVRDDSYQAPANETVTPNSYNNSVVSTTTKTDVKPAETAYTPPPPPPPPAERTSDAKAFVNAVHGAVVNNAAGQTKVNQNDVDDSKHGKTMKKIFSSMSSYDDNEKPAPAPPVSKIDTSIDNGQLVVVHPAMPSEEAQAANMPRIHNGNNIVVSEPVTNNATVPVVTMDGNASAYTSTTTTTDNYNSSAAKRANNVPCPTPMDVPSFDEAKADISALPDDGTKVSTAVMLENSYCFTSQQVFELCMLFSAERSRLEFAKTSYSKTVDPTNYFKVNNAFQEDASVKELKDYLDKTK